MCSDSIQEAGLTVRKKREPFENSRPWELTDEVCAFPKSEEEDLPCLPTQTNACSPLKYSIFIGLSVCLNFFTVHNSGATVYTCQDRIGRTIFTDSPAQLFHCQVFTASLFPSKDKGLKGQKPLSVGTVPKQSTTPTFSDIPPNLELDLNGEREIIPPPIARQDNEAPVSSLTSQLVPGGLRPEVGDSFVLGNMPPPEFFKELAAPQGSFPHDMVPLSNVDSRKGGTKTGSGPGFFIPPDVEASTF